MAKKLALPKLGPTGKKIATGTAVAGGLTLAAFTISKGAEKKRVAGADATYDKKYPFSNNCTELKTFLDRAKLELVQLESQTGGDRGAKRIRERNLAALKSRIGELEKYSTTLDCSSLPLPTKENEQGYLIDETGNLVLNDKGNPILAQNSSTESNMTKYLLYGVAAIAAILLFTNLSKKD
jgi:hypothetical protein